MCAPLLHCHLCTHSLSLVSKKRRKGVWQKACRKVPKTSQASGFFTVVCAEEEAQPLFTVSFIHSFKKYSLSTVLGPVVGTRNTEIRHGAGP